MFSIASWNIRGMNQLPKQKEVQEVIVSSGLSVCAILESHVSVKKLSQICSNVFGSWNWTSNSTSCN